MKQTEILQLVVALLIVVAIFPPVESVIPARIFPGAMIEPEQHLNSGFKFIANLDKDERIKMGQWLTEIGLVVLVGGVASVVFAAKGTASQQANEELPKKGPS